MVKHIAKLETEYIQGEQGEQGEGLPTVILSDATPTIETQWEENITQTLTSATPDLLFPLRTVITDNRIVEITGGFYFNLGVSGSANINVNVPQPVGYELEAGASVYPSCFVSGNGGLSRFEGLVLTQNVQFSTMAGSGLPSVLFKVCRASAQTFPTLGEPLCYFRVVYDRTAI